VAVAEIPPDGSLSRCCWCRQPPSPDDIERFNAAQAEILAEQERRKWRSDAQDRLLEVQLKAMEDAKDSSMLPAPSDGTQPAFAPPSKFVFARRGEYWEFRFDGRDLPRAKHRKGFSYIRELLSHPCAPVPCEVLAGLTPTVPPSDVERRADPVRVSRKRGKIPSEIDALHAAIEAEPNPEKKIELRQLLRDSLDHDAASDGQARGSARPKELEDVRSAVGQAIKRAIKAIDELEGGRKLAAFLRKNIKEPTGSAPEYRPERDIDWE
jgi:hypothetical protein